MHCEICITAIYLTRNVLILTWVTHGTDLRLCVVQIVEILLWHVNWYTFDTGSFHTWPFQCDYKIIYTGILRIARIEAYCIKAFVNIFSSTNKCVCISYSMHVCLKLVKHSISYCSIHICGDYHHIRFTITIKSVICANNYSLGISLIHSAAHWKNMRMSKLLV